MSIETRIQEAKLNGYDDTTIYGHLLKKAEGAGQSKQEFDDYLSAKKITLAPKAIKSGLLGGEGATVSQEPSLIGSYDTIGTNRPGKALKNIMGSIVRPLTIAGGAALKEGSIGFAPNAESITPVLEGEAVSGEPTAQSSLDKAAYAAGSGVGQILAGEGIGAGLKLAGKAIMATAKKLPYIGTIIDQLPNINDYTKLSRTVSRDVKSIPVKLQKSFGSDLAKAQANNPDAVVSLTNSIDNLVSLGKLDPNVKLALNKIAKYKDIGKYVSNSKTAGTLSLEEAQKLTNSIVKELPEGFTGSKIKFQFDDAIASVFDEMKPARAAYASGMDDYELLHNLENIGNNITKIRSSLVNQNIQDAAKRRLSSELTNEISKYSKAYTILKNKRINIAGIKTESIAEKLQKDKLAPKGFYDFIKSVTNSPITSTMAKQGAVQSGSAINGRK
jgi:hypothetical protein